MGLLEIVALLKVLGYGTLTVTTIVAIAGAFKKDSKSKNSYTTEDFEKFCDDTNLVKQKKSDKEEFIFPKALNIEETESVIKIIFDAKLFTLNEFEERKELLINNFPKVKNIEFRYDYNRNIEIIMYKTELKEMYNFKYVKCLDTEFFAGYNQFEKEIVCSLRRNMLVAGNVGMGKTSTIQGILLNRIWNNKNNPNAIGTDLHLIDLKGTDLIHFSNIENVIEIATDSDQAKKVFNNLIEEMNKRKITFIQNKVSDIESFNEKSKIKMRYKYLVVDELASFQELAKKEKEEIEKLFLTLASKSRAFGIIIIGATQRPDAKTLDSFIKAQLSGTVIGHGTNNKYTSETIINKQGLEELKRPGQAIILSNREELVQFPYLSTKELKVRLNKDIKSSI